MCRVQGRSKDVEDVDRGCSTYGQLDSAIGMGLPGEWRHDIRRVLCHIRWPIPAGIAESRILDRNLAWQWPRRAATATGIMQGAGEVSASFAKWKLIDIRSGIERSCRHLKCWKRLIRTFSFKTDLHTTCKTLTYNQCYILRCATFLHCQITINRLLSIRYSVSFTFTLNNSSSDTIKSQTRRRRKDVCLNVVRSEDSLEKTDLVIVICCFITMCKVHSKVTHIKQQKYFHHLKGIV